MTTDGQLRLLSELQGVFQEEGYTTELVETDGIHMLRMLLTTLEDSPGEILTELCLISYNEYVDLLQIYSTLLTVPEPALDRLRGALNQWNIAAIAGSYGIYEPLSQLFHKHNVAIPLDGTDVEQSDAAFLGICIALDEAPRRLEEALAIVNGKS